METYGVTSGDGTRERQGIQGLDKARKVAQELANETGEAVTVWDAATGGDTHTETVSPDEAA